MYGQVLVIVDRLVAGIHITDSDHGDEDEYQHSSFKDYVDNNEKRLRRNLKSYEYCIDDINTMTLITGPARLEEVFLENPIMLACKSERWHSML